MMNLSITITIPEHVDVDPKPKKIIVKFKTVEEKRAYINAETRATEPALRMFARAWTKAERMKAYEVVYVARVNFYSQWQHANEPKQTA